MIILSIDLSFFFPSIQTIEIDPFLPCQSIVTNLLSLPTLKSEEKPIVDGSYLLIVA